MLNIDLEYEYPNKLFKVRKKYYVRLDALWIYMIALCFQFIWMRNSSWLAGWDSIGYVAIGRMFENLPENLWTLKYYYSPGYPFWLSLNKVIDFDTLQILRFSTLFFNPIAAVAVYYLGALKSLKVARYASIFYILIFGHSWFSKEIMPHNLAAITILIATPMIIYGATKKSIMWTVAGSLIGVFSVFIRQGNAYVLTLLIIYFIFEIYFLSYIKYKTQFFTALLLFSVSIFTFYFASLRPYEIERDDGTKNIISFSRNYGDRMLFVGVYAGANTLLLNEGKESDMFLEKNGSSSKKILDTMNQYFSKIDLDKSPISDKIDNIDASKATDYLLTKQGLQSNWYLMWWGLEDSLSMNEVDALMRSAALESIKRNYMQYLHYVSKNFYQAVKGDWKYHIDGSPPTFVESGIPIRTSSEYFPDERFGDLIGNKLKQELQNSFSLGKDKRSTSITGKLIDLDLKIFKFIIPLLNLIIILNVVISLRNIIRKILRKDVIYLCLTSIYVTTLLSNSVVWPSQTRYWYPALGYLIVLSFIGLKNIKDFKNAKE